MFMYPFTKHIKLYMFAFKLFTGMNIRLANGPSRSAGRVEIMRNKVWGTLCSIGMTEKLATEVCKMVASWSLTW